MAKTQSESEKRRIEIMKKDENDSAIDKRFERLESAIEKLVDVVTAKTATPEEKKVQTDVEKAKPDNSNTPVNPAWTEKAEEILGDKLERCEVLYPKHGGTIFTLVIRKEKSNAPVDYLARYKEDRRSKEIGNEGIEGVEAWCKLVKQNLSRPR